MVGLLVGSPVGHNLRVGRHPLLDLPANFLLLDSKVSVLHPSHIQISALYVRVMDIIKLSAQIDLWVYLISKNPS